MHRSADDPKKLCRATLKLRREIVDLDVPLHLCGGDECSEALKEWVWSNHKEKLLDNFMIRYADGKHDGIQDMTLGSDDGDADGSLTLPNRQAVPSPELCDQEATNTTKKKLDLLATMVRIHRQFFDSESSKRVFSFFLEAILDIMDSEYGFIGEAKYDGDGAMYLQCHAITNIAWDQASMQFYNDNIEHGLRFTNLNTLFGTVMTTCRPVISNNPSSDARAGGIPDGHPPLNHFLGIPFFKSNGELYGMVGLSNKPGGYSEQDIEFLEPVTVLCANLIQIYLQREQNHSLINSLEESVKERTIELERANSDLEDANLQIRQASERQLAHFACMSHEIRTPLNCIIGMGGLMKGTKLTPNQEESIRMIVTSGDLLMAIVNDVLDYSKLETENVVVDVQKNSLHEALTTVVQSIDMKSLCTQSVKAWFDSALPEHVHMDSRRLQQVLFNLLGNAAKFSPYDGVIEFAVRVVTKNIGVESESQAGEAIPLESATSASRCPFHKVEGKSVTGTRSTLTYHHEPRRVIRFVVKDNGKGIDKDDFDRIFEPFQQANSSSENFTGGTGLGLAITKKLVTAMGGVVSVDSVKGSWTAFTVDLPCPDEPAPVEDLASKLQHWKVSLVGVRENAKENVFRLFQDFKVDFAALDSLGEAQDSIQETAPLHVARVVIVREDLFDDVAHQALLSKWPNLTTVSFGPNFSTREGVVAHHFRSLEQILPCVLMRTLITIVASKKAASAVPDGKPSTQSFPQLRVLVAEDNLVNQKVMSGMLSRLGVKHVDIVDNGLKACEREETQIPPYDVILMDQQMPVMGGVEACRRIVGRPGNHKKTPVVFVTAHVSPLFKAECLSAGGSAYIPKPFKLDQIASTFRAVCGM